MSDVNTEATTSKGAIYGAIIKIMRAVGPIAKDQKNKEQNYNFRGIDQVYNAVHPYFSEFGVFSTSEVIQSDVAEGQTGKGTKFTKVYLRMRFTFWAEDGSSVATEVVGEGMDYGGDKAHNKAMSVADKYAILQLLKIPTAMIDSDRETHDNPDVKQDAPRVQPRAERQEPKAEVTKDQLQSLCIEWKNAMNDGKFSKQLFAEWLAKKLEFPPANWEVLTDWSLINYDICLKELGL